MKSTVHYALVGDQSGSMESLKEVTISILNEQIDSIRSMIRKAPRQRSESYVVRIQRRY